MLNLLLMCCIMAKNDRRGDLIEKISVIHIAFVFDCVFRLHPWEC